MTLDFHISPLRQMVAVGTVTPHAVRLWMRSPHTGVHALQWWPETDPQALQEGPLIIPDDNRCDNTLSVFVPYDVHPNTSWRPLCPYRFRIVHEASAQLIGEGHFEIAPEGVDDTPSRFAIALMSCNQPFEPDGKPRVRAEQMYRALRNVLSNHATKLVLTVGDQLYADTPPALSLFHERYFATVAPPGRTSLQAGAPPKLRFSLYSHRGDQPMCVYRSPFV